MNLDTYFHQFTIKRYDSYLLTQKKPTDDRPMLLDLKQEVKNLTQDARSLPEFTVYPGNNASTLIHPARIRA